jgi:hypothetical protein
MANKNFLTLKALIAIIFLLIGLQYLSLLQVSEKRRGPRYEFKQVVPVYDRINLNGVLNIDINS